MPVVHGPVGVPTGVSTRDVVARIGPRVPVEIRRPADRRAGVFAASTPAPLPEVGFGLIDTGASITSIDIDVASRLSLELCRVTRVRTSSGVETARQFVAEVSLGGHDVGLVLLTEASLAPQGIIMLIGTDWLIRTTLHLDGVNGTFSLSW